MIFIALAASSAVRAPRQMMAFAPSGEMTMGILLEKIVLFSRSETKMMKK